MALIQGIILVGGDWLKSRTRGVVIAERVSRFFPRWAPEPPVGPPLSPSAATAAEEQGIDLSWSNGTGQPAVTEVWVSTDNVSFILLTALQLGQTTYKHVTGLFGVLHYYKLRHSNRTDDSAFVLAQATSQVDYPDAPPTTLSVATPGTRPTGEVNLDLAWVNGDATAQTQVLRRLSSGGTFTVVSTVAAGGTTYRDSGRTSNTSYDYFVRHVKSGVVSAQSNTATATTLVDGPDADPSTLLAVRGTGVAGQGKINLTWVNGDTTAQTFVYVATISAGSLTFVSAVAAGLAAFTHAVGAFDVTRFYKVVHVKNSINSGFSNESSANSGFDVPDADPSGLTALIPGRPTGETQVNVSWSNGDATAQTRVYRDGVLVQTLATGVTSWADTGRTANTTYGYRVAHVKSGIESNQTALVNATTLVDGPDADPTNLVATNAGAGSVPLTWTNGDATSPTEVYRSLAGGSFALIATKTAGTAAHTDSPGGNVAVAYFVRHVKNGVVSNNSNTQSLTTLPPPSTPSSVILTGGNGRFDVSWTNGSPSDPIKLYRNINDAGQVFVADLAAGTTTYFETGYAEDTKGIYYVSHAKNGFESTRVASAAAYTFDFVNAPPSALVSTPRFLEALLQWTIGDSSGTTEVNYRVVGAASWTAVTLAGATAAYTPVLLAGQNYEWFVRHVKVDRGGRTFTADSGTATFSTRANPSGLSLSAAGVPTGETQLNAAWANGDGTADVLLTLVRTSDGAVISSVTKAPASTTHSFTGLVANTGYTMLVQHRIAGPYFSNTLTTTGSTLVDGPNAPPSGFFLSSTAGTISLTWTNGDASAATDIFRNGAFWTTVGAGVTSFQEAGLPANTTRTYDVRHSKNSVLSAFAGTQSLNVGSAGPTPALTIIARDDISVTVRISGVRAQDAVHLFIRSSAQSSPPSNDAGTYTGSTSYDVRMTSHAGYSSYPRDLFLEFQAYSTWNGWQSSQSGFVGAYTTNTPTTTVPSLSLWVDTTTTAQARSPAFLADGNLELRVERVSDGAVIATSNAWDHLTSGFLYSVIFTGLVAGETYRFAGRIFRVGTDGVRYNSAWTFSSNFTTPAGPTGDPSNLATSNESFCTGFPCFTPSWGSNDVSWVNGDSSAQTEVYRSDDGGSSYFLLTTVAAGDTTYADNPGVFPTFSEVDFYYKVRHVKNGVNSGFTAPVFSAYADPCNGQYLPGEQC